MIKKPAWQYKSVEIPNFEKIQQEFRSVALDYVQPSVRHKYFHIDRDKIEKDIPTFVDYLKSINLLDRWNYIALICTVDNEEFLIHVDSLNWQERSFGLNFPIQNCHDSWTVWYNADVNPNPIPGYEKESGRDMFKARLCYPGEEELCRMPANTCAWVNIGWPHRPVSNHADLRIVASARFSPEIHDYFN